MSGGAVLAPLSPRRAAFCRDESGGLLPAQARAESATAGMRRVAASEPSGL
jgi:hypothetical protein